MRIGWFTAIILICLLNNVLLEGEDKSNPAETTTAKVTITNIQVDQILEDLDSTSRQTRMEAKKKLLKSSKEIVPYLKMKLQNGKLTPSASHSVSSILKNIEKQEFQALKIPEKLKIYRQETVGSILNRLKKETGNQIDHSPISEVIQNKKMTFSEDKTMTSWQILNLLETQNLVQVKEKKDSSNLILANVKPSDKKPLQVEDDGLFRIALKSVRVDSLLRDKKHSKLRVHFEIISESRVFPLILFYQAKKITLLTDTGISISPISPESQLEISPVKESKFVQFHIDYLLPDSVRNKLKSVNIIGNAMMLTATFKQQFQINQEEKENEYHRHLLTLKIQQVETETLNDGSEIYRLSLLADYDLDQKKYGMLFESHRRAIFKNSPILIHRKTGKKIEATDSHNHMRQDSNLMLYQMEFRNLDRDKSQYQLQFPAYTSFELLPVQFQFQNVIPGINSKKN